MRTSNLANSLQSIAANAHRRSTSGVGIIATPNFPYDINSVWNRNQLGGLGQLDFSSASNFVASLSNLTMTEWLMIAGAAYMLWGYRSAR